MPLLAAGMETDDISHMIEYLWHKGPDFDKDGAAVPLIFRIATVEDKKRLTADHKTRFAPLACCAVVPLLTSSGETGTTMPSI